MIFPSSILHQRKRSTISIPMLDVRFFNPYSKSGSWVGEQPEGIFFDARKYEQGIYSNAGYWKN